MPRHGYRARGSTGPCSSLLTRTLRTGVTLDRTERIWAGGELSPAAGSEVPMPAPPPLGAGAAIGDTASSAGTAAGAALTGEADRLVGTGAAAAAGSGPGPSSAAAGGTCWLREGCRASGAGAGAGVTGCCGCTLGLATLSTVGAVGCGAFLSGLGESSLRAVLVAVRTRGALKLLDAVGTGAPATSPDGFSGSIGFGAVPVAR